MDSQDQTFRFYRRSARTSFYLVILLVLIGGVVRSTGAGMGCPDWPKCFGLWVPPTHISEIPDAFYSNPLSSKDGQLIFNAVKTWTEYLNRLLGVVIGFAIFVQWLASWKGGMSIRTRWLSFAALVMVGFQGWLGSKVVSTDLRPIVITLHLVVALLIALVLLAAVHHSKPAPNSVFSALPKHRLKPTLLWLGFGFLFVQFLLGTEVRSQVDVLFKLFDFGSRDQYLDRLNWVFYVHRTFSIGVLIILFLQVFRYGRYLHVVNLHLVLAPLLLSMVLIFTGLVLSWFNFPAFVQPFHLFFGFLIVCTQYHLFLKVTSIKIINDGDT